MAEYNLTKMALAMHCPGNVVKMDEAGLPSVLVYIPAFKNSDVLTGGNDSVHPAFIVNGRQIPGFYYSKYENIVYNRKAYSLPAEDPSVSEYFDTSMEYCEGKGYGWHMSTAAEWAAIALWCKKNGTIPYGNNQNGKDIREYENKAIPTAYGADGEIKRVATGTGPRTWSHDGTPSGIWDMNGNVSEMQTGLRLVWGEVQILANNDAADPENPQNATSTCWKAINASDGSLVDPESKTTDTAVKTAGNTVKLDYIGGVWTFSNQITRVVNYAMTCAFASVTCADTVSDAAKNLLRLLALLPEDGATADDYRNDAFAANNGASECCAYRGGSGLDEEESGLFSIRFAIDREEIHEYFGFRSAYIPNI